MICLRSQPSGLQCLACSSYNGVFFVIGLSMFVISALNRASKTVLGAGFPFHLAILFRSLTPYIRKYAERIHRRLLLL